MTAPTGTAVAAPIIRVFGSSGNGGWRAGLCVRAGAGRESVRRELGPDHARGIAIERYRGRGLRHVDRHAGLQHAADRTAAVMGAVGGLVGLAGSRSAALPWQMTAPASGSEAAMLAAQHAPIGAKICTISAIRTMGRKFFSRRIANPSASELNHHESPKSRSGSRNYVAASRSKPGEKRCILKLSGGTLREYQVSGVLRLNPQPSLQNADHFAECWNFEQRLLKMVTRRKRWSTNSGSGWPRGSSLVVQVSGGALTRTSSVASSIRSNPTFRGN